MKVRKCLIEKAFLWTLERVDPKTYHAIQIIHTKRNLSMQLGLIILTI